MLTSLARTLARKTTLYLSCRAANIALRGKCLAFQSAGEEKAVSLADLRRVVLLGRPAIGSPVLYALMKNGVSVDWLDIFGRPLGQLLSLDEDVDRLAARQDAFCRDPAAFALARDFILAKADNCQSVLRRKTVPAPGWPAARRALLQAATFQELRGLEGLAARAYFSSWDALVSPFAWQGRKAHPAPDPLNFLLSLGYGLLHNRLASALRCAGLNPRQGFFHSGRGRHCALASDCMEPLRPVVDRTVLALVRRRQFKPADFALRAGRCAAGSGETFARIFRCFEEMFAREYTFYFSASPAEGVKRSLNDCLDDLARSVARHIEKKETCFPPRLLPCAA